MIIEPPLLRDEHIDRRRVRATQVVPFFRLFQVQGSGHGAVRGHGDVCLAAAHAIAARDTVNRGVRGGAEAEGCTTAVGAIRRVSTQCCLCIAPNECQLVVDRQPEGSLLEQRTEIESIVLRVVYEGAGAEGTHCGLLQVDRVN